MTPLLNMKLRSQIRVRMIIIDAGRIRATQTRETIGYRYIVLWETFYFVECVRGHTADADMPAAQNFLSNKRDHDGVINIVVGGVASRDIFKSQLGDKVQNPGIAGL